MKPAILHACECWGDSMKKEIFANKIEQFHMPMHKQILGVKKFTNNIKVLSELGRTPLKIDIETKMFKYFQRFLFIETNRYLFKAFKEEEFDTKGWVQNLKSLLDMLGLGNLQQNIYKILNGIIPKGEYKNKHKFLKKRATDLYLQSFYNYIDNNENKGFFTCLKDEHEKERYLDLRNMKMRNALSKLRLFSFKLAIVTGKCLKTKKEKRICKFCDLSEVEDETHFLLQCRNYKDLRKGLIDHLISTENINLTFGNKLEN